MRAGCSQGKHTSFDRICTVQSKSYSAFQGSIYKSGCRLGGLEVPKAEELRKVWEHGRTTGGVDELTRRRVTNGKRQ